MLACYVSPCSTAQHTYHHVVTAVAALDLETQAERPANDQYLSNTIQLCI